MAKIGGYRNYGYGKMMAYAGHNALSDFYKGHYATVATHSDRWALFCAWYKEHGGRDARDVSTETVEAYAQSLRSKMEAGDMALAYAVNLVSSVNVTMRALRGDRRVWLSPRSAFGSRTAIRAAAPAGLLRERVLAAAQALRTIGEDRSAVILELARLFGCRMREAALIDARTALRQAQRFGRIDIRKGTKGGRGHFVERWVSVTEDGYGALERAASLQGKHTSLIPPDQDWRAFRAHVHAVALPMLRSFGLSTIHDLRAAWACELYETETGSVAPCIVGDHSAPKAVDWQARERIAKGLGHSRIDITGAYVGGRRRPGRASP